MLISNFQVLNTNLIKNNTTDAFVSQIKLEKNNIKDNMIIN